MNNIIKENWEIIEEKVIKPMYEDGSFPLTVADEVAKALEKQIPKKPDLEADGYVDGYLAYDIWICPCCETHYEVDYDDYKNCPKCGQAIDWRNEDE